MVYWPALWVFPILSVSSALFPSFSQAPDDLSQPSPELLLSLCNISKPLTHYAQHKFTLVDAEGSERFVPLRGVSHSCSSVTQLHWLMLKEVSASYHSGVLFISAPVLRNLKLEISWVICVCQVLLFVVVCMTGVSLFLLSCCFLKDWWKQR